MDTFNEIEKYIYKMELKDGLVVVRKIDALYLASTMRPLEKSALLGKYKDFKNDINGYIVMKKTDVKHILAELQGIDAIDCLKQCKHL